MSTVATSFDINPITITRQDDETVTFTISNPFGVDVIAVYYQYAAAQTGSTKCYSESPFTSCPEPIEVTAHCMTNPAHSLAIVDVWFVDASAINSTDSSTIPECCEPDDSDISIPTVQYSFKVYCQSKCVDPSNNVRSLTATAADVAKNASELERVAKDEGISFLFDLHDGLQEDENDDDDDNEKEDLKAKSNHFCSSIDYPCGDDGGSLVYVCHYSSKDGYQTFCIPESDSDVAAYVPKDYCGPCVGGYGRNSIYRN